jgi:hypothetical protein
MATLTGTLFQVFAENKHEVAMFGSNTLKVALTNTEPTAATDDEFADITELGDGNGYTTGGEEVSYTSGQASGTFTVEASANVSWTASGGTIGPFQYIVLYDDTTTGDKLVCYWSRASAYTIEDGSTYTLSINGSTLYSDAPA